MQAEKQKTGSDLGVQRVELAICGTARSFVCLWGQLQDHNPRGLSHVQLIFWVSKDQSETYGIYTRYKSEVRTGHPPCLPCGVSCQAQSLRMIWAAATERAGYTSGHQNPLGMGLTSSFRSPSVVLHVRRCSSSILFDRLVSLMSSRNHAGDLNRRGRGQLLL